MKRLATCLVAICLAASQLAYANVAVFGTDDAASGGHAVVAVDARGAVQSLSSGIAAPEVIYLPRGKAFAIVSSPMDGKAQVKFDVFDIATLKVRSSLLLDAVRLPSISPWPPAATADVSQDESRIALLEVSEAGIGVGVYSLHTGKLAKRLTLPAGAANISMPRLMWTADGAGLVVLNTTTGAGNIISWESGQSVAAFESYPQANHQTVRFQVAGASAGTLCLITSLGQLTVAEFPGVEFDPARMKRSSLWEGAREIGLATVSANGRYLSVPQLAVGQVASNGTSNLLVIDLRLENRARYLVTERPFSVSMLDESGEVAVTSNATGEVTVVNAHNGTSISSTTLPAAAYPLLNLLDGADVSKPVAAESTKPEAAKEYPWMSIAAVLVLGILALAWWIRRRNKGKS